MPKFHRHQGYINGDFSARVARTTNLQQHWPIHCEANRCARNLWIFNRFYINLRTMSHQAAWINTKHARLQVRAVDTPKPGHGEVLVKVKAIAFSPIESKMQR